MQSKLCYLYQIQNYYVPIKLCKMAGSIHLFKITGTFILCRFLILLYHKAICRSSGTEHMLCNRMEWVHSTSTETPDSFCT